MKTIFNIILIILILTLTSCSKKDNFRSLKLLAKESTPLEGSVLSCDSLIWSSCIVGYFDNKLITRIYSLGDVFIVYDYKDDRIEQTGSFGREGSGPFEIIQRAECYYDRESKLFYIFDIKNNDIVKSYMIDASDINNLFNIKMWKELNFPQFEKSSWKTFIPLSDSIFIALGGNYDNSNLLSTINLNNGTMTELNIKFPQDKMDVKPFIKRQVYHEGGLLKRPSGNRFLYYCTNLGNYAEIITLNDDMSVIQENIANDFPVYKTAPDGINLESDMKTLRGMEVYITDNYVYLLPNFRNKTEYSEDDYYNHSEYLFIYDWNGNFIKSYHLNIPIRCFIVDENDSYILGSSEIMEEVSIIKYPL